MTYFNHLRTFVTVYRCGSHAKAGDVLGLTQPAVSKQIAALETQIGKLLFHKDGPQRHAATAAGESLAAELAPHVDQIEQIFNSARSSSKDISGSVYIGGLSEFIELHLSHSIAALIPQNITFMVQDESGRDWITLLENHTLDMAIVPRPHHSTSIGYRELLCEDLVLVVHANLTGNNDLDALIDIPFLAHIEKEICTLHYLKSLQLDTSKFKQGAAVNSFRMMKDLLLGEAGFGIIPLSMIRVEVESRILKLIEVPTTIPPLRLYLAWNNFSMQHPRHRFVRDAILDSIKT